MSAPDAFSWLPAGRSPLDVGPHLDELQDHVRDLLKELQGPRPEGVFDAWGEDITVWAALARLDVRPGLTAWFTPVGDWDWDETKSGRLGRRPGRGCLGLGRRRRGGDRAVGVAWTYDGQHTVNGAFNGLPPTGRHVLVRGFTVVGIRENQLRFWRYIDWIDLYTQLGLTINWRVPVGPPPDA